LEVLVLQDYQVPLVELESVVSLVLPVYLEQLERLVRPDWLDLLEVMEQLDSLVNQEPLAAKASLDLLDPLEILVLSECQEQVEFKVQFIMYCTL